MRVAGGACATNLNLGRKRAPRREHPRTSWTQQRIRFPPAGVSTHLLPLPLTPRSSGHFSLRSEVLLFSHMYCAGYYGLLAFTTIISPEAPLTAFARAQPEQYVSYQVRERGRFVTVFPRLVSLELARCCARASGAACCVCLRRVC